MFSKRFLRQWNSSPTIRISNSLAFSCLDAESSAFWQKASLLIFIGSNSARCLASNFWLLIIMRELKHHEKKLLRKVSLYSWKGEDNLRVAKVMRTYHIQNRDDFVAYQRICGQVTKLSAKLKVRPFCIYLKSWVENLVSIQCIFQLIVLTRSPFTTTTTIFYI